MGEVDEELMNNVVILSDSFNNEFGISSDDLIESIKSIDKETIYYWASLFGFDLQEDTKDLPE